MELIILGSGTYIPELKRHCSSYLLKVAKQNLVFDFGRGALEQLLKVGIKYYQIDKIFISHTHPDHCSELIPFLHIALVEPKSMRLRKKDLIIYGPKGIKKTINYILKAFNLAKYKQKYKVIVKELVDKSLIKGKGWKVRSYIVKHSPDINCLSYRIKSNNKLFAYSGDTSDCLGLRKTCKNADLAIIEASWPKKMKPKGHMTGEGAGKVAQEFKVKKLLLTHIAPSYLEKFNVKKDAKKFYKGPVIIAKDLLKVKI
jgi:ribonuclease BN (tRNA processing enzyme)